MAKGKKPKKESSPNFQLLDLDSPALKKAMEKIEAERAAEEATLKWDGEEHTRPVGKCYVCVGIVVARFTPRHRSHSSPGPNFIGRGTPYIKSEEVHGYHCQRCGIVYHFPPKP